MTATERAAKIEECARALLTVHRYHDCGKPDCQHQACALIRALAVVPEPPTLPTVPPSKEGM